MSQDPEFIQFLQKIMAVKSSFQQTTGELIIQQGEFAMALINVALDQYKKDHEFINALLAKIAELEKKPGPKPE